jgi:hypothetical protein
MERRVVFPEPEGPVAGHSTMGIVTSTCVPTGDRFLMVIVPPCA